MCSGGMVHITGCSEIFVLDEVNPSVTASPHLPTDCFCYEKNPPSVRRKDLIYLSEFYTELIFKCL